MADHTQESEAKIPSILDADGSAYYLWTFSLVDLLEESSLKERLGQVSGIWSWVLSETLEQILSWLSF